ncbi:DUF3152 domain-containing protein [Smaragdicoccus niigatensis]
MWVTDLDPSPTETPRKGWLRRNIDLYGWRIYAIPVLAVVTLLVLADTLWGSSDAKKNGTPPPTVVAAKETGIIGPKADGPFNPATPSYALPDGASFEVFGDGTWHTVPGTTKQVGGGHVFTYMVEVEDGNDTTALGGDEKFAKIVDDTLADPKSWTKDKKFGFQRIDSGTPDFRISFAAQTTARKICGFDVPVDTSCYDQDNNRVVITAPRWVRGAVAFDGDIGAYRRYVINHEVGHAIGFHQHAPCDTDGGLAPVMMQQTFGTANNEVYNLDPAGVVPKDGKECKPNAWPYPVPAK